MADTVESIGLGTTVWIDDGSSHAYAQVFNVVSTVPAAEKLNTVESKTLNNAGTIRQVPTLFDAGELSIKQQFTNAGFARVETLRKGKTLSHIKLVIADDSTGTTIIAPGYITQNKTDSVEADKITEFETIFVLNGATSAS